MTKRIIMIHGRSTKPARNAHVRLWKEALRNGIHRASPQAAKTFDKRVADRKIKVEVIYYGDILNRILFASSARHRKKLTLRDKSCQNAPCLEHKSLETGLKDLAAIPRFDQESFDGVIRNNPLGRVQDELANIASVMGALISGGLLSTVAIGGAFADLRDYFYDHNTASAIRGRLKAKLKPALAADDDICLISHSMGCIVAYDSLWQMSRTSEYASMRKGGGKVDRWITIGSPLGELGVRNNLLDRGQMGAGRFPHRIIGDWVNIAAEGDIVAADPKMADDFRTMVPDHARSIEDHYEYNCWRVGKRANPHKAYGYIAHARMGRQIIEFMG